MANFNTDPPIWRTAVSWTKISNAPDSVYIPDSPGLYAIGFESGTIGEPFRVIYLGVTKNLKSSIVDKFVLGENAQPVRDKILKNENVNELKIRWIESEHPEAAFRYILDFLSQVHCRIPEYNN